MKLKFGKFKTSDEILACKEEIDKNYIDIVNMKMDLILNGRWYEFLICLIDKLILTFKYNS